MWRGIDHVSCKIKWRFHISTTINSAFHVSREKKERFLYDQFFLLWLIKNYSERTALFDVLTILSLLVLGAWKGNQVLFLEVEARHHFLLKQNYCHQRSCHRIQRAGLLQSNNWSYNFSRKIKNNMKKNPRGVLPYETDGDARWKFWI